MSIEAWSILWKSVLIGGVSLFALLAVSVTIGGFFDVRDLFVTLRQQQLSGQDDDESS